MKWKTKDGRKIKISKMDDSHLINTIKMLERYTVIKQAKVENAGWEMLCSLQGEMAIYSVEQELDRIMDYGLDPCEIHPAYPKLLKELARRGLENGDDR